MHRAIVLFILCLLRVNNLCNGMTRNAYFPNVKGIVFNHTPNPSHLPSLRQHKLYCCDANGLDGGFSGDDSSPFVDTNSVAKKDLLTAVSLDSSPNSSEKRDSIRKAFTLQGVTYNSDGLRSVPSCRDFVQGREITFDGPSSHHVQLDWIDRPKR